MNLNKTLTKVQATSGTWTYTLGDVDGIVVGSRVDIAGCPIAAANVNNDTVDAVNTTLLTITIAHGNTTLAATDTTGQAHLHCHWVDTAFVEVLLGYQPAGDDATYLEYCVDAANDFAFNRRQEAGYANDLAEVAPGHNAQLGTGLYAMALYRERGSVDSFQSFQDTPTPGVFGTMGQINKLLGIPRMAIG